MKTEMRRRDFLRAGAGISGFLAAPLWSQGIWAQGGKDPAPNSKIGLGCVGVGGMGTANMKVFLGLPECRVLAVCDPFLEKQQKAKLAVDTYYESKDCAMYGDYRELLARKDIDAVMIAPQDHWHALIATDAVRAGKDLYLEKPLGVSVEECRVIRDAVRRGKRVLQTGTWQRSGRNFRHACQLARNGYLGKIHTARVAAPGPGYQPTYTGAPASEPLPAGFDWEMWQGPAPKKPYHSGRVAFPDWYLIWDYCVGFITNWGVHHLDIANWGCPEIGQQAFEVECTATYRKLGFTDNVESWFATLTYSNGFKLLFSDERQQQVGCRFIGDQGWVHVDRDGYWAEPQSLLKVKIKPDELQLSDSDHHQSDFLRSIQNRKDPVSDVDAAYTASVLGMLADISARLKTKLRWDPLKGQFAGNDEANQMLHRPMHNGWELKA